MASWLVSERAVQFGTFSTSTVAILLDMQIERGGKRGQRHGKRVRGFHWLCNLSGSQGAVGRESETEAATTVAEAVVAVGERDRAEVDVAMVEQEQDGGSQVEASR